MDFILGVFVSAMAVLLHYEAFNLLTYFVQRKKRIKRHDVLVVMSGIILAHLAEAFVFALMFWVRKDVLGLDIFNADQQLSPLEYYNFSLENYSSLGYGDLYIRGAQGRFLSALEAVIGLILISWSASFLFLIMSKDWEKRLTNKNS